MTPTSAEEFRRMMRAGLGIKLTLAEAARDQQRLRQMLRTLAATSAPPPGYVALAMATPIARAVTPVGVWHVDALRAHSQAIGSRFPCTVGTEGLSGFPGIPANTALGCEVVPAWMMDALWSFLITSLAHGHIEVHASTDTTKVAAMLVLTFSNPAATDGRAVRRAEGLERHPLLYPPSRRPSVARSRADHRRRAGI